MKKIKLTILISVIVIGLLALLTVIVNKSTRDTRENNYNSKVNKIVESLCFFAVDLEIKEITIYEGKNNAFIYYEYSLREYVVEPETNDVVLGDKIVTTYKINVFDRNVTLEEDNKERQKTLWEEYLEVKDNPKYKKTYSKQEVDNLVSLYSKNGTIK
ncbi:hypothetical protein [Haploplasma axanthum]|uniref:Uncharacterized protein n=1 Tax=Haploplasma axanthum TaxID=29552 RepID=A0A449BD55_HAPAX|nr:hypothetical protein [Haploplasma axanthum]VEU80383.1 Uncharacterised protein [Haploplasma axanthum]